jgi:hypothetical protein
MSTFNIHCVAIAGPRQNFFTELENLFNRVCKDPKTPFSDAAVWWWSFKPFRPLPHEPVIWVLESSADSLIQKVYKDTPPATLAGLTKVRGNSGNISEIYLDHKANQTGVCQAKMAFHELMHNKLQMGNDLHTTTTESGALGLGRERLDCRPFGDDLNAADIRLMAPALEKPISSTKSPTPSE